MWNAPCHREATWTRHPFCHFIHRAINIFLIANCYIPAVLPENRDYFFKVFAIEVHWRQQGHLWAFLRDHDVFGSTYNDRSRG